MNIQNGLMQLTETWSNPQLMYDSMSSGVEDYDDIFRTKGYMKKALRNLAEHRNATLEEHSKGTMNRRRRYHCRSDGPATTEARLPAR